MATDVLYHIDHAQPLLHRRHKFYYLSLHREQKKNTLIFRNYLLSPKKLLKIVAALSSK